MNIHHIRNATLLLEYGGHSFLIDPFFADQGSMPAFPNTPNQELSNPLVPLPDKPSEYLEVDAVFITHLHPDHFDEKAKEILPTDIKIFVQNQEDLKTVKQEGFTNVHSFEEQIHIGDVTIHQTNGQHGRGDITKMTGPVSGMVFKHQEEQSLYIAGDTVWCEDVEKALTAHSPDLIIVNSGAAQFLEGGPITMTAEDIYNTHQAAPNSNIIVVHMESLNHCLLSRETLHSFLEENQLTSQVIIPNDGERLSF